MPPLQHTRTAMSFLTKVATVITAIRKIATELPIPSCNGNRQ